ncbi:MAG TPA: heterodisulfide reductase-related iron-sulfur binding cluster [Gemmatimonadaceae bacterium]|nr:heterodisulfide reductase-related iron-sulfur binding cluster [Gemmatimonadaceae bacterium]
MTKPDSIPTCALPGTPLAAAAAGIDTCVHCGFCLQACPTYLALEDENDSPRGRILLMRALVEGTLTPDDESVRTHIDRCLGCRACETACPSGVPYGRLLEATRATLIERRPNAAVARLVLWIFARPALLALAMTGARLVRFTRLSALLSRLPGRPGFAFAMLESTRPPLAHRSYQPGAAPARESVALLDGCVMRGLYGRTNDSTRRTLAMNGYRIVEARGQRCCGALHAHAGDLETARELARVNIAAFERAGAERIAVNAAGCGAAMKEYPHLLADDPAWSGRAMAMAGRVRDASELLAAAGPAPAGPLPLRVTYDAPCHLLHAQRVVQPPLRVLAAIEGLELIPLADADQCCGSAGIYNLVEPETSDAVLAPKLERIGHTQAPWVATGNPGCLMQIGAGLRRAGMRVRGVHPVDLLDAAYGRGNGGAR